MTLTGTGTGTSHSAPATAPERVQAAPSRFAVVWFAIALPLPFLVAAGVSRFGLVLCPFRRITHLPCPGCGMTRALLALLCGDLPGALASHPLSPLVALVLGGWWLDTLLVALGRPKALSLPAWVGRLWWVALVAALVLWIGRLSGYLGTPP